MSEKCNGGFSTLGKSSGTERALSGLSVRKEGEREEVLLWTFHDVEKTRRSLS